MAAPFDLTTIGRVKALAPLTTDDADALITGQLIPQWSGRLAEMLGRDVDAVERTQVFQVRRFQRLLPLPAYPVTAVSAVSYGSRADDLSALTEYDDWFLDQDARHIRFASGFTPRHEPGFVSVTWTGGMAADTDSFVAAFPDLAGALDAQVVHALERRRNPAGSTETFANGTLRHELGLEVLPELRAAAAMHARRYGL